MKSYEKKNVLLLLLDISQHSGSISYSPLCFMFCLLTGNEAEEGGVSSSSKQILFSITCLQTPSIAPNIVIV